MAGVLTALAMSAPPSASAAIEVGNACEGVLLMPDQSFLSLRNAAGSPLPAVIPSAGVVTGWKTRISGQVGMTVRMVIGRATGAPTPYKVLAESDPGTVAAGLNTFPARLPVHTGDLIGLSGHLPSGRHETPVCIETGAAVEFLQDPGTGQPNTPEGEFTAFQLPVVAILEPDADNDGYGDETQDKCPQNAGPLGGCPTKTGTGGGGLSAQAKARRRSVVVTVSTGSDATVSVTGSVRLRKGSKPLPVRAATRTVAAGSNVPFVLKFPAKLTARLKQLPRKRSLQMKITAEASFGVGHSTTAALRVKLKGRARS